MPPYVAATHAHDDLASVFRNVAGTEDQILDDCAQTAPLHLPLLRRMVFQGFLTNHTQEIIGEDCQFQHQTVRGKFSGRQTLYIHIGLYFAVVLLAFTMRMIR